MNQQASMTAAVWHGRRDIRLEQVALPGTPPPGWVQIKVHWCGICGSDLHEYLAGPVSNGAFAELVNVPANLLYRLPEGFPSEAGALIEPLAVGMHAVKKAGSLLDQSVVVVGAGTIGLCTIMCAKAAGASRIIALEM